LHYARTCRLWHDRLAARREEAIALVAMSLSLLKFAGQASLVDEVMLPS
jgi:hypothetical protein